MTNAELFKTEIWREFEATAKSEKENPINLLIELMSEYLESHSDTVLFDEIAEEGLNSEYTEDDVVELVRQARRERIRG